jgi:hypothetical protein
VANSASGVWPVTGRSLSFFRDALVTGVNVAGIRLCRYRFSAHRIPSSRNSSGSGNLVDRGRIPKRQQVLSSVSQHRNSLAAKLIHRW